MTKAENQIEKDLVSKATKERVKYKEEDGSENLRWRVVSPPGNLKIVTINLNRKKVERGNEKMRKVKTTNEKEIVLKKLNIFYTNADSLRNKMEELNM